MLSVVCGDDCDHVGDFFETSMSAHKEHTPSHKEHTPSDVELHYKTISYTQKHRQQRYL